jgi:hypothetical protein
MRPVDVVLIGNPANRRVTLFREALAAAGGRAEVVSWLDLATRGSDALREVRLEEAFVRIDSAGEDFEVERAFLRLGWEAAVAGGFTTIDPDAIDRLTFDLGRITCPRQAHLGFLDAVERIRPVLAERPGWRVLTPLDEIGVLFDKRVTSRRYASMGLPVPPVVDGVRSPDDLARAMDERGIGSVFVKLSCSSSASCLAIYHRGRSAPWLFTTIEDTPSAWYNTLKVRRVQHPGRIDEILSFLIRDGSQIEEAMPKAKLDGAHFDCRFVTIAGEPELVVVRQNRHPITNLHLGGFRGSIEALEEAAGSELARALDTARAVAECHQAFTLGIDVMFDRGFGGHRVLESNAFGDLFPNLVKNGRTVYGLQVERLMGRRQRSLEDPVAEDPP